jgi:hypothetical protein
LAIPVRYFINKKENGKGFVELAKRRAVKIDFQFSLSG